MNLFKNVHESWIPLLHGLAYKEPMVEFLESLNTMSVQPELSLIFRVFEMPVKDIKVVILGQEPYPLPRTANGLAYGVKKDAKSPNILEKIRREVVSTVYWSLEQSDEWDTLEKWEKQGVFLLNTALTVETGKAHSHKSNWRNFIETVVSYISHVNPCVWMLWGANPVSFITKIENPLIASKYDRETIEEIIVDDRLNYVIPGSHPASTFFENADDTFSNDGFHLTNTILRLKSLGTINW